MTYPHRFHPAARALCAVLALVMCVLFVGGCGAKNTDQPSATSSAPASGAEDVTPENSPSGDTTGTTLAPESTAASVTDAPAPSSATTVGSSATGKDASNATTVTTTAKTDKTTVTTTTSSATVTTTTTANTAQNQQDDEYTKRY